MNYKRYPIGRKYSYNTQKNIQFDSDLPNTSQIVEKDIPLPNAIEDEIYRSDVVRKPSLPPFFGAIRERIGPEELLIVGLILLLIMDGIQDEFLILILLFILFT